MSPLALRRAVERLGVPAVIFFSLVTLAAGISAILLLGWPGSTGRTFSWTLRPPAAAALIGGFYLASSAIFGIGLTRPWTEVRAICVAVYGLIIPTLVETFVHLPVFEFSRWQALLWVALFVAAPLAITYVLWSQRERPLQAGRPLVGWTRAVLALSSVVFTGMAAALLVAPSGDALSDDAPFALVGLTGSYLGAWCAFAAILCGWTAWRDSWAEARFAVPSLVAVLLGGVLAAVRAAGTIRHGGVYLSALMALAAIFAACWRANVHRVVLPDASPRASPALES